MSACLASLNPRKPPSQARSAATVAALQSAAIQVLTHEGLSRCTTTRIAERAGVSVGSLYQYYPNRDSLLADVLERHLVGLADAMAEVCRAGRHRPLSEMAIALVRTFVGAKLHDPDESRALYAVAGERGGPRLIAEAHERIVLAIAQMLESASDAVIDDPMVTATITFNVMVGPILAVLNGQAPVDFRDRLEIELTRVLTAYLEAHQSERVSARPLKTGI